MEKPHVVCIPLPAQGHINPMLKLAKLLHSQGFHVTFVHTEFNYSRLMKCKDPLLSPENTPEGFRFETISDGLPPDNQRGILDLPALASSLPIHSKPSFKELILRLNGSLDNPPVSCIVSDGVMGFTLEVADEFGIPEVFFFTPSACAMLGYLHFGELIERGYFPLKDESCFTNGYLDTKIDWIPAMEGIRLKDLPTFLRTTDENDIMFNYNLEQVNNALKTKTMILNTFEDLEQKVLDAIRVKFPRLYTIGPLVMLEEEIRKSRIDNPSIKSSLWEEDTQCLKWLDKKENKSVLYVNFGSLVIMTTKQLREFAWGLANSKYSFFWAIRPNLVSGIEGILSKEFLEEIEGRGLLLDWCPQESVVSHPAIGGFLTHCGWNSTLESIGSGVPLLCWPFFADQQINCHYASKKWGFGMEIEENVDRRDVEGLVRELMDGQKGKEMRTKAIELQMLGEKATKEGGSSYDNFHKLIDHLNGVPFPSNR